MEQLEELLAEIVTLNPAEAENYATHFGTEIAKVKKLHAESGKVMATLNVPNETFNAVRTSTPRNSFLAAPNDGKATSSTYGIANHKN